MGGQGGEVLREDALQLYSGGADSKHISGEPSEQGGEVQEEGRLKALQPRGLRVKKHFKQTEKHK